MGRVFVGNCQVPLLVEELVISYAHSCDGYHKKVESTCSMQVNAGSHTVLMWLKFIDNVNVELERYECNSSVVLLIRDVGRTLFYYLGYIYAPSSRMCITFAMHHRFFLSPPDGYTI